MDSLSVAELAESMMSGGTGSLTVDTAVQSSAPSIADLLRSTSTERMLQSSPIPEQFGLTPAKQQRQRIVSQGFKQTILGSPEKDVLDVAQGQGKNIVKGLGGNDILRANTQDQLLGGSGRDRLVVEQGKGRNRLKGGAGGDRIMVWKRDRAFGNGGADTLTAWETKGNNRLDGGGGNDILIGYANDRLTGGGGADEFQLTRGALPKRASRIMDFTVGVDRLRLRGLSTSQINLLQLTQAGDDTVVGIGDVAIARLKNVMVTTIDRHSFVGLSSIPPALLPQDAAVPVMPTPPPNPPVITPPVVPPPVPPPTPISPPSITPPSPEPSTRNPILHPFASTSIWNTPIGADAQYVPANIQPTSFVSADIDHFYVLNDTDEEEDVFLIGAWRDRASGTLNLGVDLPLPEHLLLPDANTVETPNNSSAFLLPDGDTVVQFNATTRVQSGGNLYGVPFPNASLSGDGIQGGHGGSGLSSIGGTLRIGELTGEDPIQHVLKVNLWAKKSLSYSLGDQGGIGFRWPAVRADSYANATTYGGTVPELVMGSLLAIPPTASATDLGVQTEPGLKLFNALRDYGAYVADDTAFNTHAFAMENGALQDFEYRYGYEFGDNETPFFDDVMALFSALHVVDNNAPDRIGGGGTLRQSLPLALDQSYVTELQDLLADPNIQDTFEADFNNDGNLDLLWRNLASGANQLWLRDENGTVTGGGNILPLADPNWQIERTSDLNGDGRADILWTHRVSNAQQEWYLDDLRQWIDPVTGQQLYRWQINAAGLPTIVVS